MKYPAIKDRARRFRVSLMCRTLREQLLRLVEAP